MPNMACQSFVSLEDVLAAPCACSFDEAVDGPLIEELIDEASDMLFQLSGGRVHGICTRTVRPIAEAGSCWHVGLETYQPGVEWWLGDAIPFRVEGLEIIEVVIDGVVLSPSGYKLINSQWLARVSGYWPTTNDLMKDDTEDGTFSVTYRFGRAITAVSKSAAVELVCLMMKDPSAISRLRGVVSANVQGVNVTTAQDDVAALGLPAVARFLDLFAPFGPGVKGVWSPDTANGWRLVEVTGPSGS